jgi:hypothetical protein
MNGCVFETLKKVRGGVSGTRVGSDVPQTRYEQKTSLKRSIQRCLGMLWGTRIEMLLVPNFNNESGCGPCIQQNLASCSYRL